MGQNFKGGKDASASASAGAAAGSASGDGTKSPPPPEGMILLQRCVAEIWGSLERVTVGVGCADH
jgi:hypothetical protein